MVPTSHIPCSMLAVRRANAGVRRTRALSRCRNVALSRSMNAVLSTLSECALCRKASTRPASPDFTRRTTATTRRSE